MFYRVIIALLLSASLLSGCSVYDAVFHPHRLGTPKMSEQAKAKARAAEKARHKGMSLQPTSANGDEELADTGTSAPGTGNSDAAPTTEEGADKTKSYKDLPASIRNTYDKKLLLRRSKLQRLQYSRRALHHYDLRAPKHTDATRDARHLRTHPKNSKNKAEPREPKEPRAPTEPTPAPDPTQPAEPAPAPTQKQPKPAAPKATKAGQDAKKKQPKEPKPDPTQPPGGN